MGRSISHEDCPGPPGELWGYESSQALAIPRFVPLDTGNRSRSQFLPRLGAAGYFQPEKQLRRKTARQVWLGRGREVLGRGGVPGLEKDERAGHASPSYGTSSSHWPDGCGTGLRSLSCRGGTRGREREEELRQAGCKILAMPGPGLWVMWEVPSLSHCSGTDPVPALSGPPSRFSPCSGPLQPCKA